MIWEAVSISKSGMEQRAFLDFAVKESPTPKPRLYPNGFAAVTSEMGWLERAGACPLLGLRFQFEFLQLHEGHQVLDLGVVAAQLSLSPLT